MPMELIYFWTTSTNPTTIQEPQGFNLGSEYDFVLNFVNFLRKVTLNNSEENPM